MTFLIKINIDFIPIFSVPVILSLFKRMFWLSIKQKYKIVTYLKCRQKVSLFKYKENGIVGTNK